MRCRCLTAKEIDLLFPQSGDRRLQPGVRQAGSIPKRFHRHRSEGSLPISAQSGSRLGDMIDEEETAALGIKNADRNLQIIRLYLEKEV